jgi:hypothetical protein
LKAKLRFFQNIDVLSVSATCAEAEASQVVSQVGVARVANPVDPNYTVVAKFPKKYLPKN